MVKFENNGNFLSAEAKNCLDDDKLWINEKHHSRKESTNNDPDSSDCLFIYKIEKPERKGKK